MRERLRLSRAGVLAVSVTVVLAAGTTAVSLAGRRSPASAHTPPSPPAAAPVAVRVALSGDSVAYGARVRVTGTIRAAAGAPLAGRIVEVLTAPPGDRSGLTVLATPMTDANGRVTAAFTPRGATEVWLRYAGGDGFASGSSAPVRVTVAPRVTVRITTVRNRGGWTSTLRGSVTPASGGDLVRLDRQVGAGWRTVSSGEVDGTGRYSFTVRNPRPGTYTYRVVRPADETLAGGSATRDVRLVAPPAPRVPPGARGGGPRRLLVTGDSFAFYLGQQLAAVRKPRVTTVDSKHSSGLSRPDFFDWSAYAREQVAGAPGAVVAFLGANDCQPIRVQGTGRWVSVGTDAWVAEYRRRAAELMRVYSGGGARPVYWIGLPIVQKPDIAACYRAINTATAAAAHDAGGVRWVDSWTVYAVNGRYSEYVSGVLARQEDGIHLTYEGTRFLTRKVYALLGS